MGLEKEETEMQRSFKQFMMNGGGDTGKQESEDAAADVSNRDSAEKADRRLYWQKVKAFQQSLQRDWLDVDDDLERLVASVSNLRHRLELESTFIEQNSFENDWKQKYGYRHGQRHKDGISREDVQETLDYDLKRHEQLIAGGRVLMASLSQAQDALGRRLEEVLEYSMIEQNDEATRATMTDYVSWLLNHAFALLAMELHRKQLLFQKILDSCGALLNGKKDNSQSTSPARVAESCSRDWRRGSSSKSFVNVEMLEEICNL